MAMEKTTDWSREKEAAAKHLPLAEKINPGLHKTAKRNDKHSADTAETVAVAGSAAAHEVRKAGK